ncbi:MAG: transcription elongation factor GreA [Alphaproteobacteria bacterium]|nr:MAG: transcription elongation factor GreA [Alphaproteobacteria bacterium]
MAEKVPMTRAGYEALQAELKNLKQVERPAIIAAIEEARAHGDLSENAEYHAAKEKQGQIQGRIYEVEDILARADVIDPTAHSGDRVVFAATVTVADEDDKTSRYQIVGEHEADVKSGRISYTSPLGRALIGRTVGDEVVVTAPGGDKSYEITKIEFI